MSFVLVPGVNTDLELSAKGAASDVRSWAHDRVGAEGGRLFINNIDGPGDCDTVINFHRGHVGVGQYEVGGSHPCNLGIEDLPPGAPIPQAKLTVVEVGVPDGTAILGRMLAGGRFGAGVRGESDEGHGVIGVSQSAIGVEGCSENETGVFGQGQVGVAGFNADAADAFLIPGAGVFGAGHPGVLGVGVDGPAGRFVGSVEVTGSLTKAGGGFRIDHPLDPARKYLSHSFVESPDMKNIYDGVVALDEQGEAAVELPGWFEALNGDFRYHLTPIGGPAPDLHVAEEVVDNRFRIGGGAAGMKVSWMVTGTRHDPWANAHRIRVEGDKQEKGGENIVPPPVLRAPPEKWEPVSPAGTAVSRRVEGGA
jgi:hypothetical protein